MGDPVESDTDPNPFYEIYRTSDGGQNWNRVSSDNIPAPLPFEFGGGGEYFVTGNHVWFPTFDGVNFIWTRVFHSADRGATWTATSPEIGGVSFADSLHAIGTAFNDPDYSIRYTDDGWLTWTDLPAISGGILTSIVLIPESYYILAVLRNSNVSGPFRNLLSKDFGQSWIEIGNGAELIDNMQFASPSIGYAGEWQSLEHPTRMFKYAGNPLVGLFSGLELDAQVTLSPNPASEVLQVQIEVAEPTDFVVLLNDLQGRLIERKTLDQTAQGNARFDISQLPAGMYTLMVSSEKGHLTRTVSKQ
ncbi:MAG: T9SS type A sorting domain-containing protein [Saprospiraceae bacterium]|nr:T9SS type A sorting domain-containing protein [Saprospiraceae bacterium]